MTGSPDARNFMELITVLHTLNPDEAHLAQSRLEAAGFAATIAHEAPAFSLEGNAPLAAGGIWVQVPSEQSEDAKALLGSGPTPDSELPPAEPGT